MLFTARAADGMEKRALESRPLVMGSQCTNPKSGLGFTTHWLLTGMLLQSPHAWSKLWEPHPPPRDGALDLTASPRSPDPPTRLGSACLEAPWRY